jgi:PAS domain S-box-containing protein
MNDKRCLTASTILEVLAASNNATAIYTSDELIIEFANDAMINFWGKDREIIGMSLCDAVPELNGQPFFEMLRRVLHTGITDSGKAIAAELKIAGKLSTFYYDYEYRAVKNADGEIFCILHTAVDVTDEVKLKKGRLSAEANLKMALESAEMGTWIANLATDELIISDRARIIHGINQNEIITLSESFGLVAREHRESLTEAIAQTMETGTAFGMEYLICPKDGSAKKWLRATGKADFDRDGRPVVISGTMIDITDQKEAEQRKDDFLSIASHELKTPVTSLRVSLQLLERDSKQEFSERTARLIDNAAKNSNRISRLIDELLNVTRLNRGQLTINKTAFRMEDLLESAISHFKVKGTNIIIAGEPSLSVYADEHQIEQVVVNMIDNAEKYAPKGENIYVTIQSAGSMVRIAIKDQGEGIPKDQLKNLFDRYYRATQSPFKPSGLGLGLYICAEIIRKHNGEIGVESELNEGSEFWFTLPSA